MKRMVKAAEGITSKKRQQIAERSKDPRELSRLAHDNALSVRMAVFNNDNTPQNVRKQLAKEFIHDDKMLNNIENYHTRRTLFRARMVLCDNEEEAQELLESNSKEKHSIPGYVYDDFSDYIDNPDIQRFLYDYLGPSYHVNKYTPYDIQVSVAENGTDNEGINDRIFMQKWRLVESTTYPEILKILMKDKSESIRVDVTRRSDEFDFIIPELLNDRSDMVVGEALSHVKDRQTLVNFINSKRAIGSHHILYGIAEACEKNGYTDLANDLAKVDGVLDTWQSEKFVFNNATDPDVLVDLARKEPYDMTDLLANPNSPDEVFRIASSHFRKEVREAAAKYAKDPQVLAKLAKDRSSIVREAATNNPNYNPNATYDNSSSKSKSRTPQADWSIPIYRIKNYSEIEKEIDRVIQDAAEIYARKCYGDDTVTLSAPSGVYDDPNGKVTLSFVVDDEPVTFEISVDDILGPATARNKKSDCVKYLAKWLESNLE